MAEAHGSIPRPTHPGQPEAISPPANDVNRGRILWQFLALVVAAVVAFLVVTWLINLWTYLTPRFLVPDNIKQLNVQVTSEGIENRKQFQQSELDALQNYRILNPQQGTIAIPIERAKELILERGLPVRPEGQRPPNRDEASGSAGERSGRTLPESQQSLPAGGGGAAH